MASPEIVVLAEAPRKKARKQNFSPTEIATLTEKVEENLAILQSKLERHLKQPVTRLTYLRRQCSRDRGW